MSDGGSPESLAGAKVVSPKEAREIQKNGGVMIACYTHMTDWMEKRPVGAIHITVDVPKDHKREDLPLEDVQFDMTALPKDKNTAIILFCADDK